jgi:hypothetical protein
MSNYNGKMGKGYSKILKGEKRSEAEQRNAKTTPDRKSKKAKKGQG